MKIQKLKAWAALEKGAKLQPIELPPAKLGGHSLLLEVLSCGICHSDVHLIDNDWSISSYPLVPGHEILGRVVEKGNLAIDYREGDIVGVGWQRGACLTCDACISADDNLCEDLTGTCVGHSGGYADYHVADSRFCFKMPSELAVPEAAPLLCGGVTVYSPLVELTRHTTAPRVGVIGIGGLGHMAIKMAAAMGFEVTAFSSSSNKEGEALKMGAHNFAASTDPKSFKKLRNRLDLVISTAAVDLSWSDYLRTLRNNGTLCFVGVPPTPFPLHAGELMRRKLSVTSGMIGSRTAIREMLEFCARMKIKPDTEVMPMSRVNEAIEKVRANTARYRMVVTNG